MGDSGVRHGERSPCGRAFMGNKYLITMHNMAIYEKKRIKISDSASYAFPRNSVRTIVQTPSF
jgi:hypothetical protein